MSRKIACLTLDVEADFLDPTGRIRLFEDEALFERFVAVLQPRNAKLTAFLVTSLLPKHGADYRRLAGKLPVEFAIHSHAHDMRNPCTRGDIEQSVRAFRESMSTEPLGYRAPLGHITREGLETLMDLGLRYDSSIYPSARPGRHGYNHLHLPITPFRIRQGERSIVEVPFASLSRIRLNFSLSYVKLFGWKTYELLLTAFPLPKQVAVLTHPHDFYFHLLKDDVTAWEKPLLMRNARGAYILLEKMLDHLIESGYQFEFLGDLCAELQSDSLPEISIERVARAGAR
jgi:peptidoglycan/xylan/chitin deacetylase (PgdA/CDA1 family)